MVDIRDIPALLRRALTFRAPAAHRYVSTACLHGRHDYCARPTTAAGCPKRPAACKFCDARCLCTCHHDDPTGWGTP